MKVCRGGVSLNHKHCSLDPPPNGLWPPTSPFQWEEKDGGVTDPAFIVF
jgi:hypothetical protein